MKTTDIAELKRQLRDARIYSLTATRAGDFMKVAYLASLAARLNKEILDAEADAISRATPTIKER
jgi:hypothetical protein